MDSHVLLRTLVVPLSALAVAIGAAACGGDDDGSDRSGSARPALEESREATAGGEDRGEPTGGGRADRSDGASAEDRVSLAGDKKEARKASNVADGVYRAMSAMERTGGDKLVAGGGGAICGLMSGPARRQTIQYARRSSGLKEKWTCPKAVGLLVGRSQRLGGFGKTLKAEVVGVNAEGDRATATIRFGKGPLTTVPLVRENGKWKLGTAPAAARARGRRGEPLTSR